MKALFVRLSIVLSLAGSGLAVGLLVLILVSRAALAGAVVHSPQQPVELAPLAQPSTVYDRDGNVIAILTAGQNRTPVGYSALSGTLVDAVVDTEDHGFFDHGAIDVRSIVRAVAIDLSAGAARQGGSTITQQLVKNGVLSSQKTLSRKLHEAVDAVRLEDSTSRQQILDDYLNTVYFGNGAYGVQAAAETYYGQSVSSLDTAQSALLAGLIQDPSGYDPIQNPGPARARRAQVLALMVQYGHITQAEADQANIAPLPTVARDQAPPVGQDGYFVEEVTQGLLQDPALGSTPSERYRSVFEGGLRITTTLDPTMEKEANAALADELPDTHGRFTGALVSIDPDDGGVRALAVGTDFATAKYDIATGRGGSGRQVGSSFKPFVLLTAFTQGYSMIDRIDGSAPCLIDIPGYAPYTANNYEGEAYGTIDLTSALASSVNCAYLRLGAAVGLPNVVATAHALGITSPLEPYPSLPLGTEELTPLQMASAYCTIDDAGVRHAPHFVERVLGPTGHLIENDEAIPGRQVVPRDAAEETVAAMEQVVIRGTGTAANLSDHQVAGKTGTTSNYGDAWFVGFSRQLCTSVWMGSPTGDVSMDDVDGIAVAGGTYPARIWHAFMTAALEGAPDLPLMAVSVTGRGAYIAWPPVAAGVTAPPTSVTFPTTLSTTGPGYGPTTTTVAGAPVTSTSSPGAPTTEPPTTAPPTTVPATTTTSPTTTTSTTKPPTTPPTTAPHPTSPPTTAPHPTSPPTSPPTTRTSSP